MPLNKETKPIKCDLQLKLRNLQSNISDLLRAHQTHPSHRKKIEELKVHLHL